MSGAPFSPLLAVFGDPELAALFSERARIEAWLEVERALAVAQAEIGAIPADAAAAIEAEATVDRIDIARLNEATRTVGYPILPLLEQLAQGTSPAVGDYIHWGATTQDIMDTGLALQLARGLDRIEELQTGVAAQLCRLARRYRAAPIAGRTHGQQAVPTTFGAKVAVWLDEFSRHLERLRAARVRAVRVQLFGAGGTAAALGPSSREVREAVARRLGLGGADVPWHTSRDALAEVGFVLAAVAATCGKIAREIIELSRTEIDEVRERGGPGYGASSTMPQKVNPIASEVVVGFSMLAREQVAALLAAMQPVHERAAGEWQAEWDAVPTALAVAGGCLLNARLALEGLQVFPERMHANLTGNGGMVMAEAVMIALAPRLGRLRAHELVTRACDDARTRTVPLAETLPVALGDELAAELLPLDDVLAPDGYLGEAQAIVEAALGRWEEVAGSR